MLFRSSFLLSLKTLDIDSIDLLLIHWPSKNDAVPFEDYMTALAEAKQRGFAKRIGVSNYPVANLKRSDALIGAGQLATNQIEIHPYLQSPTIRDYAKSTGLQLTAYMPLAKGRVGDDEALGKVAARHGVSPAAIALAFLIGEGHIVIPSSANPQRLRDNYAALAVELNADEVATIRGLDRGDRMINPAKSPAWDD